MNTSATSMAEPVARYNEAIAALNAGDWKKAQSVAMNLVRDFPPHAGVHFVAGTASLQLGQGPLAMELLKRAVAMNPQRPDYAAQYSRALAMGLFLREAVEIADRALALAPSDPLTLDTLGVVYTQAHAHEKAITVFREAARQIPTHASFQFNLATSLTFTGELEAAEQAYLRCLELEPKYWKAYLALSQLRRQTEASNHVQWYESALPLAAGDENGLMYLQLALAKELEDLGQYSQSFGWLSKGKAAKRDSRGYSPERDRALFEAITEASRTPGSSRGSDSREPIFVIGMPRSGTTLVDRILSSHSQVHSAGELQNFGVLLKRATGVRSAPLLDVETVSQLASVDWRQLGDAYIASTRPATAAKPHFIDKLPHNFLYAGFIASALPNARIVALGRNAMDTCLSNFRQLFALSSPYYDYSFELMDTARYYVLYHRLMAHWRELMPGRIIEVDYEHLVDAQEDVSRALLAAVGLEWEDSCLQFDKNQAPVSTASAVQVRVPMYRTALQRWKKYEDQMAGVAEYLQAHGIDI